MNEFRRTGRTAQWVIRELGLPALVKACVSCRSSRHHPTGKFRVNANGKLLDVWMLIRCERCGRTAEIPVHERTPVQALGRERLRMFEANDPVMVRDLAVDAGMARNSGYQLDWSGTWELGRRIRRRRQVPARSSSARPGKNSSRNDCASPKACAASSRAR